MRAKSCLALSAVLVLAACGGGREPSPSPPAGGLRVPELGPVPELPAWEDDPPTDDKIALGTDMFFDARLSASGHSDCNGCHLYLTSFQDNLIKSIPDAAYPKDRPTLPRNTLSFNNIVYAPVFRWDGSHTDLIDVMAFPFAEPNMNLGADVPSAQAALAQRLAVDVPGYVPLFQKAYGEDITALAPKAVWRLAGRALAAFARKAVSRDSAFDKWNAGDDGAMSAAAVRGLEVFRKQGKCVLCHHGPFFTDFSFHNLSTSPPDAKGARDDEGRYLITHDEADRGAFLTPTLRSTYVTGPYFHDGSAPTLREVIGHLASEKVKADPNRDPIFDAPLALGEGDIDDLVELMGALRGAPVADTITPPMSP